MRIAFVLGTRPEIIKMSPLIRECVSRRVQQFILHTGQHYSYEMDQVFFEELELPGAEYNLDVGSGTHGRQTGRMLEGIERVLADERPDVVLVQGDTNTVAAGALAARKLDIPVGHVEAGLRSGDRRMPEETNRIVADHLSDLLFAPTSGSAANLAREGLGAERIFVTGNTIVDAVIQNLRLAREKSEILEALDLRDKQYMVLTSHRQENVDDAARFGGILQGSSMASEALKLPVIYPIHPRAKRMMESLHLTAGGVRLTDALGYLDFLRLESSAKILLTDSGGVQEESSILGVPCVTLRENTERPETLDVGSNVLAGTEATRICHCALQMASRAASWKQPFGEPGAASRILDTVAACVTRR